MEQTGHPPPTSVSVTRGETHSEITFSSPAYSGSGATARYPNEDVAEWLTRWLRYGWLPLEQPRSWRCFHCDEVFFDRADALVHFGCGQDSEPACRISQPEHHVMAYVRDLECQLARYRAEDSEVMRAFYALSADVPQLVRTAEEQGYARGVADMRAQGHCPEPARNE